MCRQRRDASTSWREDTRPCYGGDARNHVGLEFKLTADDAQRALRKWAKCVPNTPPDDRHQGAHKSHIIPIAPTPDAHPVLTSRAFLHPKRSAKPFRPWSLVDGDRREPTLRPVFLPYWVFDVTVSVKYRGKVGFDAGEKKEWVEVDTWRDGGYHDVRRECTGDAGVRELRAQAGPRGGRHRAARGQVTLARRDQR